MDKPKEAYDIPSWDIDPLSYTFKFKNRQAIVGVIANLNVSFQNSFTFINQGRTSLCKAEKLPDFTICGYSFGFF